MLLGVFALLFRDYRTDHFVSAGIVCLITGLLHAIPTALLSWLLLRRGFAVNFVSAGLVGGTLAGLAGVTIVGVSLREFPGPARIGLAYGSCASKRSTGSVDRVGTAIPCKGYEACVLSL